MYRHCYEASAEGSWLVEVTENSHLSCLGKKDLGGRVLCRRQQSTQQWQESTGFDYNLGSFRGVEREKTEPKKLRLGNKKYEILG